MKSRLALILLVLALVVFVLVRLATPPRPAPRLEELPRSALVLTNGFLSRIGEATPFTGWMFETNQQGGFLSRSLLSNGVLNGVSEGFYTNGQRQVLEHFQGGVSHGLRTKWHPNGNKESEAMIVDGKINGLFRRWSPEGRLSEEITMKDGQPHGESRSYFPSGFLKTEVRMFEGRVVDQKSFNDGERHAPALQANSPTALEP